MPLYFSLTLIASRLPLCYNLVTMDAPLIFLFAYLLIIVGFIGSFLPLVPGALFIWIGILLWAWGNGFQRIGLLTLIILAILTLIAWASEWFLSTLLSRKAGASWKAILAALVCGLLGGLLLSELPIIGTISGALIGAWLGMWFVVFLEKRDGWVALKASLSYLVGSLLSNAVEIFLSAVMIGIFIWQAFF